MGSKIKTTVIPECSCRESIKREPQRRYDAKNKKTCVIAGPALAGRGNLPARREKHKIAGQKNTLHLPKTDMYSDETESAERKSSWHPPEADRQG